MHNLKSTLILSLTALILLASYVVYNSYHEQFVFIPVNTDKSIYIYDRKNKILTYCTSDNQCKPITLNLHQETEISRTGLPNMLSRLMGAINMGGTHKNVGASGTTVSATHEEDASTQAVITNQQVHTIQVDQNQSNPQVVIHTESVNPAPENIQTIQNPIVQVVHVDPNHMNSGVIHTMIAPAPENQNIQQNAQ